MPNYDKVPLDEEVGAPSDVEDIVDPNVSLTSGQRVDRDRDEVQHKIFMEKYGALAPVVVILQKVVAPCMDKEAPVLIGCVVSIIGSLMLYGIMQERIITQPYGEDKFGNTVFLVLNSRLWAAIAAVVASVASGVALKNVAPIHKYLAVSISNVIATSCQYEALKYVNFPTQTLGKCAKMIPVMIWGTILSKKKYTWSDYGVAVAVTVGSAMFLIFGDISSGSAKEDQGNSFYGLLLMVGYLGFDGFTSTWQSKLFTTYDMATYNLMLYVNLCSAGVSAFTLVSAGQVSEVSDFVSKHPSLLGDAALLSVSAVFAQFVITFTIKRFGALIFATIMTTRQFLSILVSTIMFSHPMTGMQWVGTCIVFMSLYYSTWSKHRNKKAQEAEAARRSTQMQETSSGGN